MSNKYEIWPFLIGRSYDKDYKVIVTPDFISSSENTHLLSTATGDVDSTDKGNLISRQVYSENSEPFTVLFQVKRVQEISIRSTAEDLLIDSSNNNFLMDRYGRPINIVEGIVVKTSTLEDFQISRELFEEIHCGLMHFFKNFWEGDTTTKSISSRSLHIQDSGSSEYLKIEQMEPLDLRLPSQGFDVIISFASKLGSRKILYIAIFGIFFLILILIYNAFNNPEWKIVTSKILIGEKVYAEWKIVPIETLTGEKVYVDSRSIRKSKDNVHFTYKIGNKQISASANCVTNQFIDGDESKSLSSQVTRAILDYACR